MVLSVAKRQFGVSTHLYQSQRLSREHLLEIAAHGFEAVELFATRTHFDYHNELAVADLQQWLAEAGLDLHNVVVPPYDDPEQAVLIARRIPVKVVVIHAGPPRDTAKTIDRLSEAAAPLHVGLAIDSRSMSPIGSLVHFVETASDARVGICFDFEHAQRTGDVIDALETASEHLVAARMPTEGAIDWASALTTLQKIGYEGSLTIDASTRGTGKERLVRAKAAREKMERWLTST